MRKITALLLFLFSLTAQAEIPHWWVNYAVGYGADTESLVDGLAANFSYNLRPFDRVAFTLRATSIIDNQTNFGQSMRCSVTGALSCTADNYVGDLGVMVGYIIPGMTSFTQLSIGVSHVRTFKEGRGIEDDFGVPIEIQAQWWSALEFFGFGVTAFGNLNTKNIFGVIALDIMFHPSV